MSVAPGFVRTSRLKICAATSQASPLPVTLTSRVSASPLLPQINVLGPAAEPTEDGGTATSAAMRQTIAASIVAAAFRRIPLRMQFPPGRHVSCRAQSDPSPEQTREPLFSPLVVRWYTGRRD